MRAVVQRVTEASVHVDGILISEIQKGMMVLLGITDSDEKKDIEYVTNKLVNLRIFDDENGVMNKSALDMDYEILLVSQFTLYGDARKGNRPSYVKASKAEIANEIYEEMIKEISKKGITVKKGKFQADMKVALINDGPVTILIDSSKNF